MLHGLATLVVFSLAAEPAQRLLTAYVAPYDETASVALPSVLPENITVPEHDLPEIERMLLRSPTFRQQCARLARVPSLRVTVQRAVGELLRDDSAVTTVLRGRHGHLAEARVYIGASRDIVQYLAHELEHILEQVDGVDLATMASRPNTGVSFDRVTLRYETARATAIGLRVAREVAGAR
jgi:hypothetical protein